MENIESQLLPENFANLFTFFAYLGYFDLPVIASKERMAIAKSLVLPCKPSLFYISYMEEDVACVSWLGTVAEARPKINHSCHVPTPIIID